MTDYLDGYSDAYSSSSQFYEENLGMIARCAQRIIDGVKYHDFKSLLSLGLGHQLLSRRLITELGEQLTNLVLLEGSEELIQQFRSSLKEHSPARAIHCLFEEFNCSDSFDVIEMGFVLEHVISPIELLRKFKNMLNDHGRMYISVPNARSLHRLLGKYAGYLDDLYALSAEDLALGHRRYFDLESLSELVSAAELRIVVAEGLYLKPFTTKQLASIKLPENVIQALYDVGKELPALSNGIFLEVAKQE